MAVLLDALQVVGEERALVVLEKVGKFAADAILAAIAERLRGRRVMERIVPADGGYNHPKAELDELAIAPLAVVQRDTGLLPRRSHPCQRRQSRRSDASAVVHAQIARVLLRHSFNRDCDYRLSRRATNRLFSRFGFAVRGSRFEDSNSKIQGFEDSISDSRISDSGSVTSD